MYLIHPQHPPRGRTRDRDAGWISFRPAFGSLSERRDQLVLDEPTDLPEGEVFYLQPVEADELDEDERARLHEALRESIEQMRSGQTLDAAEALAELLTHR